MLDCNGWAALCTAWFFTQQERCGKGQLWWWCWVVTRVKSFQLQTCSTDAHDGHKSRYRQRPLNNQSFWEADAKWRCGIKKKFKKKVPGITSTLWPSWSISVDLLTEQIQRLSCHPVFSAPPPAYSCCSIATVCRTAGSLLRTLHDSANCGTRAARHTWQLTDRGAADCYFDWRLVWIRAPSSPSADLRPRSKSNSLVNHSRPGDFWILTFVSLREPTGLSRPLARPAMT